MSDTPLKVGWLKKRSREGLIKNVKNRFFVLEGGKIKYYEKKIEIPPYGDKFKGELSLRGATVEIVDRNNGIVDYIYVLAILWLILYCFLRVFAGL